MPKPLTLIGSDLEETGQGSTMDADTLYTAENIDFPDEVSMPMVDAEVCVCISACMCMCVYGLASASAFVSLCTSPPVPQSQDLDWDLDDSETNNTTMGISPSTEHQLRSPFHGGPQSLSEHVSPPSHNAFLSHNPTPNASLSTTRRRDLRRHATTGGITHDRRANGATGADLPEGLLTLPHYQSHPILNFSPTKS